PAGRFLGMRRLNLEYYSDWAAPVRDRLGMWLMREAGVPASRVNHVRVFKDGALLGLYQNIEPVDREWLEDHFGGPNADGNLWESGEQLQTNESHPDPLKLMAFQALVEAEPLTGDHNAFWASLSTMMDIKQVLREMAAETALITHDNFTNNLLNFYLYEHPKRGLLVLPWDFDDILIPEFVDADPYTFWEHGEPGKLRLLINQNPRWKTEYDANLIDIRDRILSKMPAYLDRVCAQVRPTILEETNTEYTAEEFDEGCAELRTLIPARIAALKRLLGR
ncbi:MAG TPA: CotH kinase family protein, partial [Polyangia bacterium]